MVWQARLGNEPTNEYYEREEDLQLDLGPDNFYCAHNVSAQILQGDLVVAHHQARQELDDILQLEEPVAHDNRHNVDAEGRGEPAGWLASLEDRHNDGRLAYETYRAHDG